MTIIGPLPINKGWVSDSDFYNCPSGGALTFSSFQPWANGSIKTIDGQNGGNNQISFRVTGNSLINGFTSWQDPAQITVQPPIFVVPTNSKVYTAPFSTIPTFTDRTGGTTVSSNGTYTFDSLNGKLLLFNSGSSFTTVPLKLTTYNGNVSNLGGTPPIGNIVKVVNNIAFVGQVLATASTASTVYWSNVNDPETWTSANNITFRNNDGDYVSALAGLSGNLIIFKQRSIGVLSTNTIVTSGVVTLGPLTQLTDRIGCASAHSVDQMPDGTLVFLGGDRILYQTDGNTINPLSNLPSPESNFSFNVNFVQSAPPVIGFQYSAVKVDPLTHKIFVLMNAIFTSQSVIYVYDYLQKSWMDWSGLSSDTGSGGTANISCINTMENQVYNSINGLAKTVWFGTNSGWIFDLNPLTTIGVASQAISYPCVFETSIQLGGFNPPDFIPRNLLIPFQIPKFTGGTQYKVDIGWDGTYQGSSSSSGNLSSSKGRIRVPISETPLGVGLHPITMQIKLTLTANAAADQVIVEPFYITDEVIQ